jgi:hypothetical protein
MSVRDIHKVDIFESLHLVRARAPFYRYHCVVSDRRRVRSDIDTPGNS